MELCELCLVVFSLDKLCKLLSSAMLLCCDPKSKAKCLLQHFAIRLSEKVAPEVVHSTIKCTF